MKKTIKQKVGTGIESLQVMDERGRPHQFRVYQLRSNQLQGSRATGSIGGTITKVGQLWVATAGLLGVSSQGKTKRAAIWMLEDAIRVESNLPGLKLETKEPNEGELVIIVYDEGFNIWLFNRFRKMKEKQC